MRLLKRIVVASSCLVAIVLGIGFLTSGVVKADPKASDVRVVNSAAEAVPVDEGNTARAGVAAECHALTPGPWNCSLGTVPAGKILVIEAVSCFATVPGGAGGAAIVLNMASPGLSGGEINFNFPMALALSQSISGGNDYYRQVVPVRLYAAGGHDVSVLAAPPAGSHDVGCSIAGHLVNQ